MDVFLSFLMFVQFSLTFVINLYYWFVVLCDDRLPRIVRARTARLFTHDDLIDT